MYVCAYTARTKEFARATSLRFLSNGETPLLSRTYTSRLRSLSTPCLAVVHTYCTGFERFPSEPGLLFRSGTQCELLRVSRLFVCTSEQSFLYALPCHSRCVLRRTQHPRNDGRHHVSLDAKPTVDLY